MDNIIALRQRRAVLVVERALQRFLTPLVADEEARELDRKLLHNCGAEE